MMNNEPRKSSILDADHLQSNLRRIDQKGYKAYKDIQGQYRFPRYQLLIDHVQGDPFASPSRVRVRVERKASGFPEDTTSTKPRAIALCDFLTREFYDGCRRDSRGNRGTGKSGLIVIDRPGQEVLERSSMVINDRWVEARFFMGLPATGRRVSGRDAEAMFFNELPRIVIRALYFENHDQRSLYGHIQGTEDAGFLRDELFGRGLVGFVADGSLLPRASGVDPRPMAREKAVLFESPEGLRERFNLPNRGSVSGMGIPEGVTLIVGGGYHGKSTLLNALELGVYNHIPGDGRELTVTNPNTVKIRAADGRYIEKTDISPFINNLPFAKDTRAFSTENASGSTSQAANICEAIEAGTEVLLLDEDTSASNFMIRDSSMQQLVLKEDEPITPFIDKVRQLYRDKGVSAILVMGGSGDYFGVADHVIQMKEYVPYDVTLRAHQIAEGAHHGRIQEGGEQFGDVKERIPLRGSFDPERRKGRVKISASGLREIVFGHTAIDLGDMDQIVDISQTRAIGRAIHYAIQFMDDHHTLAQVVHMVSRDMEENGIDILVPYVTGDLARFRGIELAGAINRMRTLRMRQKG